MRLEKGSEIRDLPLNTEDLATLGSVHCYGLSTDFGVDSTGRFFLLD